MKDYMARSRQSRMTVRRRTIVITYTAGGAQKVAVAVGLSMAGWPTKPATAKVVILGLDSAAAKK